VNIPFRVFIVEDSALIRERIIDDLVAMGGYEVTGFAESEGEALVSIEESRPDIVVTDLRLKEGSGVEVVRRVSADPRPPAPRIFVLTNYAFPEYRRQCLANGAEEFFDKTSEYGDFLSLMRQIRRPRPVLEE
jgi:CheY-like chemotaxis protein